MPFIFGNIFCNACNPDPDFGYPVKAHGSQFGLFPALVRRTIPDFENIPAGAIGLRPYTALDGKSRLPGGYEPSASDAGIVGTPTVGETVTATWRYSDPEGVPGRPAIERPETGRPQDGRSRGRRSNLGR